MPPAPKRDLSVILFDLAATPRDTALQTLVKIDGNNFFESSKNLTKLILLNSKVTANRINARTGDCNNINEVDSKPIVYDPKRMYQCIIDNENTSEANWLEGLLVALQNLEDECEELGGIITRQILFITDLATPLPNNGGKNNELVHKIIREIKRLGAFLYVVGPNIEVPFPIKSHDQVKLWMRNLNVDGNNENLTILEKIISKTENSVVCDYKMGIHLFFSFKNWGGTQPWQVPLTIGSKIQIPCQTLKILNDEVKCKLVSSEGPIRDPKWVNAEDETVEVNFEDVINGILRHEKFVKMPDNKMFEVQNPRSFNILCFTDSVNVPEYLMRGGGCYAVLPNGTPENKQALNCLIDRLAAKKKYAIARRIYNANLPPKIVVLVPKPDHNPKCFLFIALPYADDLRVNYKEKKVELAPQTEINKEINNFLECINIEKDNIGKKVSLGVNMMQDVNTQKIVNKAADKLLDAHLDLEGVDTDLLEPARGEAFDALEKIWPKRQKSATEKKEGDGSDSEDFDWK